jgi:hypothetical protein
MDLKESKRDKVVQLSIKDSLRITVVRIRGKACKQRFPTWQRMYGNMRVAGESQ